MTLMFSKASYGNIVAAGLIDAALVIGFFVTLFAYIPENRLSEIKSVINTNLLIFSGFIGYRLIFISLIDRTPGMKVFRVRFLNSEEESLNILEKLLATIFVLYKGVDYYKRF